jgi:hypothetical protein
MVLTFVFVQNDGLDDVSHSTAFIHVTLADGEDNKSAQATAALPADALISSTTASLPFTLVPPPSPDHIYTQLCPTHHADLCENPHGKDHHSRG